MARIVLLKDGQAIPYEITSFPAMLGRHPDCFIKIDSSLVSRFHAQIINQDGKLYIEDQGSGNGSFVNGRQLEKNQPHPLRHGDRIKLGPMKLRF